MDPPTETACRFRNSSRGAILRRRTDSVPPYHRPAPPLAERPLDRGNMTDALVKEIVSCLRSRGQGLQGYLVWANQPWTEAAAVAEEMLVRHLDEPLSLVTASEESGYTVGHLRRLVGLEAGYPAILPNAGTADEPRVLRRNLPRKPGHRIAGSSDAIASDSEAAPVAVEGGPAAVLPSAEAPLADAAARALSSRTRVARAVAAGV